MSNFTAITANTLNNFSSAVFLVKNKQKQNKINLEDCGLNGGKGNEEELEASISGSGCLCRNVAWTARLHRKFGRILSNLSNLLVKTWIIRVGYIQDFLNPPDYNQNWEVSVVNEAGICWWWSLMRC